MLKVGENNFLLGSFRGRGSHKNAGDSLVDTKRQEEKKPQNNANWYRERAYQKPYFRPLSFAGCGLSRKIDWENCELFWSIKYSNLLQSIVKSIVRL